MIDNTLIESALQLTGKTMEDMEVVSGVIYQQEELTYRFSIEKFCYYLLSPEFLIAYNQKMIDTRQELHWWNDIWWTIAEYQSWNEESLKELLSKIWN